MIDPPFCLFIVFLTMNNFTFQYIDHTQISIFRCCNNNSILPRQDASDVNEPPNANNMNVLVAEDDPVNSKIIKKRLERLGHSVYMTVNIIDCHNS